MFLILNIYFNFCISQSLRYILGISLSHQGCRTDLLFCKDLGPHFRIPFALSYCYEPGVTRKELGNQIMTNYYSQESQQQALLKFNNLLRNDKIINYQKQWKICTIKESLVYSTLILSPNCPSELTHTNPSTVSDPQISKSYYNFK